MRTAGRQRAGVSPVGEGRAALVLLAAGDGRRSGHHTNKVLLPLAGRRVLTWSIRWAGLLAAVSKVVVVIREQDRAEVEAVLDREAPGLDATLVVGGATRHGSEWEALQVLAPAIEAGDLDVVVIHDAARPLAGTDLFARVIAAAAERGGAIPVRDHVGLVGLDGPYDGGGPGDRVVAVQTPQGFRAGPVLAAYRQAASDGFVGTDTASCVERYTDIPVCGVDGDAGNVKITFPEDLFLAERLLAKADWDLSDGYAS